MASEKIQSLSDIQWIFNTGPCGELKIKMSKIGLRHVLSWPKLGLEPKCHDPVTFGGFRKCAQIYRKVCFISIENQIRKKIQTVVPTCLQKSHQARMTLPCPKKISLQTDWYTHAA